tara:strand:- start:188 stop:406 length:219 start_codon:yes stop_codon:yes gene_type:complete
VTSETDITGQAKKMGRNAGLTKDGALDSVHSHSGIEIREGTLSARTKNPDLPDSKALANTDRHKNASIKNNY